MLGGPAALTLVALTFGLAGVVKGVTGMGLPTVAVGLLGLMMAPVEAVALLIIPSLVTNVWQFVAGEHRQLILFRTWPLLLASCIATWAAAGLLAGGSARHAATALGLALTIYAGIGLANVRVSVSRRLEPWLSPLIGAATGVVAGATGVFTIPAVPYLQALGLEKEELVQALGLSFTVSTVALAAGLASNGAFHVTAAGASILCTAPALAGMFFGQWIRVRVDPATFRLLFLIGLLILGADLAVRSVI
ncbi:MAG: sulfite exporter TauE/SafE family protein [Xanthobacteraceae bacterium]